MTPDHARDQSAPSLQGDVGIWPACSIALSEARRPAAPSPTAGIQRRKELHRPTLPLYNRPTAGAPGLGLPQHVTSGDGSRGPMLLNRPGPILLKTDRKEERK